MALDAESPDPHESAQARAAGGEGAGDVGNDRGSDGAGTMHVSRREFEALRRSEERLRQLVEDVKDHAIYMLDPEGRVASWNVGAERVCGYLAADVMGRPDAIFYPQEDVLLGKPEQVLRIAAERGRTEDDGWRLRRDGSRFWANVLLTRMHDPAGAFLGFSAIVRDQTERRLIEEALRESNRRIVGILESISDAFCAVDSKLRFTYVNPEAERLLERTRAELIGARIAEAFPQVHNLAIQQGLERALAQRVMVDVEHSCERLQKWFDFRVYPSEMGLSVYFQDVTERKQSEQGRELLVRTGRMLAESLDYDVTLEKVTTLAVPDFADWAFAMLDGGGEQLERFTVAHADPVARARAEEMVQRFPPRRDAPRGLGLTLRTGVSDLVTVVDEQFLRSMSLSEEHYVELRRYGLVSSITVPLRARGRVLGAIAFSSTRRRYAQRDLELAEELGQRAALAVDNARLYGEAQAAIQAREDVVSIASHDLKAPLSSLKLRLQLLAREARRQAVPAAEDPLRLGEKLGALEHQVDRLVQLVDFFLESSRAAAGFLDLKVEEVEVVTQVAEVVTRFNDQLEAAGCALTIRAPRSLVARCDRMRFDQVVTNLVSNAIKFGKGAPIEIGIEQRAPSLLRLEVADHGVGVPREEQEHIFDRFRRAPGAKRAGFGLGLWIVRRIVESHGGTIAVESAPDAGARFVVEMPLDRQ